MQNKNNKTNSSDIVQGFLKKKKTSARLGLLLSKTNKRYFECIFESQVFGYKSNSRDLMFKKSYKFDNFKNIIKKLSIIEINDCDWKHGFKIQLDSNKYITLYAETQEEKHKWINAIERIIHMNSPMLLKNEVKKNIIEIPPKTVSHYIGEYYKSKSEEESFELESEEDSDSKKRQKNNSSFVEKKLNKENIKIHLNNYDKKIQNENLKLEEGKYGKNLIIKNGIPTDHKWNKNDQDKINITKSPNTSNMVNKLGSIKHVQIPDPYDEIPRRNLLYPKYIETPKKPNESNLKMSTLQKTLILEQKLKSEKFKNLYVNGVTIDDWNYYDGSCEIIEPNKPKSKSINKLQNRKRSHPENLLFHPMIKKIVEEDQNIESNKILNNINDRNEKENDNLNTQDINNDGTTSKENDHTISQKSNIFKKLLVDNIFPLNNYHPGEYEKSLLKSSSVNNKAALDNSKNIIIEEETKNNNKVNISIFGLDEQNMINNPYSKTSNKITERKSIQLQQKTPVIKLFGKEEQNLHPIIPEHHKYHLKEKGKINSYFQSDYVGNVDEKLINYFKANAEPNVFNIFDDFEGVEIIKKNIKPANKNVQVFESEENVDFEKQLHKKVINKFSQMNILKDAIKNKQNTDKVENGEFSVKEISKQNKNLEKMNVVTPGLLDDWEYDE